VSIEHQPGESNWDYCNRFAKQLDKDKLIHDLIGQIDKMRLRSGIWRGYPLWSLIGDATTHGSGFSGEIERVYYIEYKEKQ